MGGASNNYSTDEQVIGKWIDGKPLYQKTVEYGSLPNSTNKTVNHNIENIDAIVNVWCIALRRSNYDSFMVGNIGDVLSANTTGIYIRETADRSQYIGIATIQYTKTTD